MHQNPAAIKKKRWRKRRSFNLLHMYSKYHCCLALLIRDSSSGHFIHICLGSHHVKSLGVSFPSFITWGLITLCECLTPKWGRIRQDETSPSAMLKVFMFIKITKWGKSTKMEASSQAKYIIEYWEIVSNEMHDSASLSFSFPNCNEIWNCPFSRCLPRVNKKIHSFSHCAP